LAFIKILKDLKPVFFKRCFRQVYRKTNQYFIIFYFNFILYKCFIHGCWFLEF